MKSLRLLPLLISLSFYHATGQNVSSNFPVLETLVHDSSGLSDDLIAASMTLNPIGSHAFLFSGTGMPMVHIWGDGSSPDVLQERPLGLQWWEEQGLWTLLYLDENDSTAALISEDLENFEKMKITRLFDSRALTLTENGKRIAFTLDYRNAFDQEDWVMGDSVVVEWLSWHIEDSQGQVEVIDLADVYSTLDIYDYGYHVRIGTTDTTADPIHPNSIDHFLIDTVEYFGSSNRTLNELLVMRQTPTTRNFFHFGGPLNQFTIPTDSAIAYRAHDFRILAATDSTVTVSCFSNGDGISVGGDYAAGKVMLLNLNSLTSELVREVILCDTAISIGMGSFHNATNTFSPGIFRDLESPLGIASTIVVETDDLGNRELEIRWTDSPAVNFRTDRYSPAIALPSLKRPTLTATCDGVNSRIVLEATTEGTYDELVFVANGMELTSESSGTAILPSNFMGDAAVFSRLLLTDFDFRIDKYSNVISFQEGFCVSNGTQSAGDDNSPPFAFLNGRQIQLSSSSGGVVLDLTGKQVAASTSSEINVSHLSSGVYVVVFNDAYRTQRLCIP
jgi:hypothetical protein